MAWAGSLPEGAAVQWGFSDASGPPPPDKHDARHAVTQQHQCVQLVAPHSGTVTVYSI